VREESFRSKEQNKKAALNRMIDSKVFQAWIRLEVAARLEGHRTLEKKIDKMLEEENLKIEVVEDGEWKKK